MKPHIRLAAFVFGALVLIPSTDAAQKPMQNATPTLETQTTQVIHQFLTLPRTLDAKRLEPWRVFAQTYTQAIKSLSDQITAIYQTYPESPLSPELIRITNLLYPDALQFDGLPQSLIDENKHRYVSPLETIMTAPNRNIALGSLNHYLERLAADYFGAAGTVQFAAQIIRTFKKTRKVPKDVINDRILTTFVVTAYLITTTRIQYLSKRELASQKRGKQPKKKRK